MKFILFAFAFTTDSTCIMHDTNATCIMHTITIPYHTVESRDMQ
jgi:hypothetical protein